MSYIKIQRLGLFRGGESRGSTAPDNNNTISCLICHKKLKQGEGNASQLENSSPAEVLIQIARVLEVSSSIYRGVDLNEIPEPLICSSCSETVVDAFKLHQAIKTLQTQLKKLTGVIKRDIIESFHLDNQKPENTTNSGRGQVALIRKTYTQCWTTCEVRAVDCEVLREVPSVTDDFDDDRPSPFSGCPVEYFGESDEKREDSEKETWKNSDVIKSESVETEVMPIGKRNLTPESISSDEVPTKLKRTGGLSEIKNLPSGSNADVSPCYPSATVSEALPNRHPKSGRKAVRCNRCGKLFTHSMSLKKHMNKKNPCVNRSLNVGADSGAEHPPSGNDADCSSSYPSATVIKLASRHPKTGRKLVKCNRCGMLFTHSMSLKKHMNKKKPCVDRSLSTGADSSLRGTSGDIISESKLASSVEIKTEIPVTTILLDESVNDENILGSEDDKFANTKNHSATTALNPFPSDAAPEDTVRCSSVPIDIHDDSLKRLTRKKLVVSYNDTDGSDFSQNVSQVDSDSSSSEFEEREPEIAKAKRNTLHVKPSGIQTNWKCPQCPLSFPNSGYLRIHRREAHGYIRTNVRIRELNFKCDQCDRSYTNRNSLVAHIQKKHLGIWKALPCNLCDRTFTTKFLLKRHIEIDHGKHSECNLCGETVNEERLQHHIELHNGFQDFPCKHCNDRLPTCRSLTQHINRYHSDVATSGKKFKCKSCPQEFSMFPDLLEHRMVHKKVHINKNGTTRTSVTCPLCRASCKTEEMLHKHMRYHVNGSKSFKCDFCDQTFVKFSIMKDHINTQHALEIQRALTCTLCGNTLPSEERLSEHLILHNGQKDFPCKDCPIRFTKETSLKSHANRRHQTQIRHQCGMCKQIFPTYGDLCVHKKSDHGASINFPYRERAYKCTLCPKAFTKNIHLTRHLKRHGGKENYNCTQCGAVFKTSQKLKYHQRFHDKGRPIPVKRTFKFKCHICETLFNNKNRYEFHMKVHENPDEIVSRFIQAKVDDQKNLMSFHCQVCKQTFSKESHTNAETNQLEIVCQHGNCPCKATFTDLKNFMLHHKKVCQMRYGLANFDMRVNCDECGKECPNSKQLVAHKHRYHPGPDSLMCQYCGQAFGLPHMLEFHMLTHTTERNIQCHICGNKYKYKSILRTHLAICHSEPRFPCDVCEKKFKTREHLRKHKFCVHSKSEPKFPCHICGKLFKSREYVINHIYSTHEKRRKPRDKKSSNHDGVGDNDNNTDCNSN